MRQHVTLVAILMLIPIVLLGGCVQPTIREMYSDWPEPVLSAIERGDLIKGMTYEQAECVVGRPEHWVDSHGGNSRGFYALGHYATRSGYNRISESVTLYFRHGKLVHWAFASW